VIAPFRKSSSSEGTSRFEALFLPHMDAAYNLARWLCGNSEDAEDVVQEAYTRAFRFFASFRDGEPRAWLLAIVRNTYYSEYRKRRESPSVPFDEELHAIDGDRPPPTMGMIAANPEATLSGMQDARLLQRALEELAPEFREPLVLREIEDLSYKEMASVLDIPMGTVMSRLSRARRMLLARFTALGGEREYRPGNSVLSFKGANDGAP
jgi:RNA polymerase sigma-70 factor (ECF subfamily)